MEIMTIIILQNAVLPIVKVVVEMARILVDLLLEPVVIDIHVPIGLNSHRLV